jgi:hypothetical protein
VLNERNSKGIDRRRNISAVKENDNTLLVALQCIDESRYPHLGQIAFCPSGIKGNRTDNAHS